MATSPAIGAVLAVFFVAWQIYTALNHGLSLAYRGSDVSKALARILALPDQDSDLARPAKLRVAKAAAGFLALFTKTGDVAGHFVYGSLYIGYFLRPEVRSDREVAAMLAFMHWAQLIVHVRRYRSPPPPPGVQAPWLLSRGDCCIHVLSAYIWLGRLLALSTRQSISFASFLLEQGLLPRASALATIRDVSDLLELLAPRLDSLAGTVLTATLASFVLLHRVAYGVAKSFEEEHGGSKKAN